MVEWLSQILGTKGGGSLLWIIVDITIVYYIIYRALLLIKGTRAVQMLVGLTLIILLFFVSKEEYADLPTLHWLLDKVIGSFIFIIIVIFQKDIRRALVEVGKGPIPFGGTDVSSTAFSEELIRAVVSLSERRLGALIVIERETDLTEYVKQGVTLDAEVTKEILFSVFIPQYQNPLHDGALMIQKGRVAAAACYLPLSDDPRLERSLGSRHRAGLGLTEETDAVVVIVSEETGTISVAVEGKLTRGLDASQLRIEIQRLFGTRKRRQWTPFWRRGRATVEVPTERVVEPAPAEEETAESEAPPDTPEDGGEER